MADYIKREVAIARLTALEIEKPNATLADARRALRYVSGERVAEVVHGRWVQQMSMAPEYECSICGAHYEWFEVSEAHFCPNCGAKMDFEQLYPSNGPGAEDPGAPGEPFDG